MPVIPEPNKILIILHGSIGDVVRAFPLVNLLRRRYPRALLAWSVEPLSFPLVETHPAVDQVILFDRRHWLKNLGGFLVMIRSGHFDLILDLQRHLKSGFISWWSGAPYRLGFHRVDTKEFNWIFNNRHIPAVGDGISKLSHYLKFAEFLGIDPNPVQWGFRLTSAESGNVGQMVAGFKGDFAVFFVGSSWESKRWFPKQAAESAAEIRRRFGLETVLLGSADDRGFACEMESLGLSPLKNLVGQTSLREAAGILARARVSIGPDTGLMHLSAAVGTPVVSLWGATNPLRTGPHGYQSLIIQGRAICSPCYRKHCSIGRICMQSIGMEQVAEMVGKALSQSRNGRGG
jgi:lipopolysaccharide heptosyltransferase II